MSELNKADKGKSTFFNSSRIELKPCYNQSDLAPLDKNESDCSLPGEYPFPRGIQPSMYRGRLWTMRQYAGFGSAQESNRLYKSLLAKGTTGLSIAFDLPTQMGYDSNHPMASGEVGKVGVAISTIEDMNILLEGIPLEEISSSMTINSTAGILLAFYIAIAKQRGFSLNKLRGTIQNDILKEYIARGTYIYPPQPSMRIITDIFDYCGREVPEWNTISISGYHIREAGATAAQEIAFTLANGITYVQAALSQGLSVDDFAGRLSFFFNVQNNFFEEIAKFRAARRLWAKIMKERFGAKDPRSMKLRFHSQTAGVTLTAQQPENNIVRVTLQALAAVLGGTQSLHTNSMDEALGLPTESAVTIALRTQQIIAHESGVTDVADPVGGSFYIESLTNQLETLAMGYIDRIEALGGVIACIESGWIQNEIQNAAYKFQLDVESGNQKIVGVNCFETSEQSKIETLRISDEISKDQISRLNIFLKKRNASLVKTSLERIQLAAQDSRQNLMPLFVEAVENKVTLGEISDTLRKVFGQYKETLTL
ncbi:MAG: methylmalonyl-CoA mutase [Bdellovibrionales bacterium]|nr:methylmalonyl-CoA mutase [Bdellovibrionales bacterium]